MIRGSSSIYHSHYCSRESSDRGADCGGQAAGGQTVGELSGMTPAPCPPAAYPPPGPVVPIACPTPGTWALVPVPAGACPWLHGTCTPGTCCPSCPPPLPGPSAAYHPHCCL